LLGHKTQTREAAIRAATLFWVLICPNASCYSYNTHTAIALKDYECHQIQSHH
jgi:hypothetical protein